VYINCYSKLCFLHISLCITEAKKKAASKTEEPSVEQEKATTHLSDESFDDDEENHSRKDSDLAKLGADAPIGENFSLL
jgi:hypothetical protein